MRAAVAGDERPLPLRKSLRGKGLLATLVLMAYVMASALYLAAERGKILEAVAALDLLARHERVVALAEASVNSTLAGVDTGNRAAQPDPWRPADVALALASSVQWFDALDAFDPSYARLQRALVDSSQMLAEAPQPADWIALRQTLVRTADELEIQRRWLTEQREAMTRVYQRRYDAVTVELLLLAAVGLAFFGALAAWFLGAMAGDIRRLDAHAGRIVQGARGVALPVHRSDELGRLMRAVNRVVEDLDEREKQIEVDSQRRAHQDKMLSVGALAAGIAHEVNNPLAAITGAAQALRAASGPDAARQIDEASALILAQAERAAHAARQLADVAAPEAAEVDWIDLNALVRRVVQLVGYDRRYRHFHFDTTALDPGLPALRAAGDAVRHALMQIVSVACDSMVGAACLPASLKFATACAGPEIRIYIALPQVLDFSRPAVQRTLTLCRAIIEPQGGRLAFDQGEAGVLRFTLALPADRADEQG